MVQSKSSLKWGIAAAALISHDFANALGTLSEKDHEIVAIAASRDVYRAQEFADHFDIPTAYGSYLDLAQDPVVEIVYIATLIPQHAEVAHLMLDHGKHVLVEKPLCSNGKQVKQLVRKAKQKKLFMMEAIWSRFFPSYQYIRNQINDGKLGDIISVDAAFGRAKAVNADRLIKKELGGSTTADMGIYAIQLCQWIFQRVPKSVKAIGKLNEDGVDIEMIAELKYGDNKVGRVRSSLITTWPHEATIVGTKGTITIPVPFRCPETIIDVDGTEKTWPLPKARYPFHWINSCGLRYEAEEVRKCIRAGKTECEFVTHNDSIIIADIQDEIRRQIGSHFDYE